MAIIYSYPSVASIQNPDLFIISRVLQDPDEISNFSVTADVLATFVTARVNLTFQGGVGTGIVNLDTQSLNVIGTTNEIETTANAQTLQIGLPDSVTITNNLTIGGGLDVAGTVRLGFTGNDPVILGDPNGKRTEWNNPGYLEIYAENPDSPGDFNETVDIDGEYLGGGFIGVYPVRTEDRHGVRIHSRNATGIEANYIDIASIESAAVRKDDTIRLIDINSGSNIYAGIKISHPTDNRFRFNSEFNTEPTVPFLVNDFAKFTGQVTISGNINGQAAIEGESLTIHTGPSTITGELDKDGSKITNLADPTAAQDAATKAYVDAQNTGQVTGTGTTQTLPVWSDGPNGVLSNSPIKVVQSTSTPSPTFGENILIGSTLDLAVESKKTLQIGDDNIIGSLLGKTKNSLLVGQENSIIASATKPEIINSAVVGLQNEVTANNSLVAGRGNVVQSNASFVTGKDNSTSSAPRQFVIGRQNTVDSEDGFVVGDENTVTTITTGHKGAMVFGNLNNVLGDRVFCLGTSNTVASDNQNAFIIGKGNTSTANNSYSIGLQNSISSDGSYTLGKLNTLASPSSVAIGIDNELNGEKAYAFGNNNSNIGIESFAIGRQNNGITNDGVSAARETYLIGFENKLVTDNTIILGRFSDTTVLSTDSTEERSTIAFAVGASDSKRRTAWEFRGRSKNFGNTKAGDSMRIMAWALLYSTSYADDAAAAAGGVELGQLYRTGSTVKIRMT